MIKNGETYTEQDIQWMRLALEQATIAQRQGEIPVGAVIVHNGQLIAAAHNSPIQDHDPSAHAEINALRLAAKKLGNYRLLGCTVYVTLEPCAMCTMAMLHARVSRIVYGAADPKTGAVGSVVNLLEQPQFNHQTQYVFGVLKKECCHLLKTFFQAQRSLKKGNKIPLREDVLRTPEKNFKGLSLAQGFYNNSLPSIEKLRLHYYYFNKPVNKGNKCFLLIHDVDAFSVQYAEIAPLLISQNQVLIPDLLGFGRSDKPKKESFHTPQFHARTLCELLEALKINQPIELVLPASLSALCLAILKLKGKEVFTNVSLIGSLPRLSFDVASLPYPNQGYCAGPRELRTWANVGVSIEGAHYYETLSHWLEYQV